jgi:hypothetical protein
MSKKNKWAESLPFLLLVLQDLRQRLVHSQHSIMLVVD